MIHLLIAFAFTFLFGTITIGVADRNPMGEYVQKHTITFDASYPTNGYAVTPTMFGFERDIAHMDIVVNSPAYQAFYNSTTAKIQVVTGALVEVTNATDLSALVASAIVRGR